jgi:hypothetical protein
MTGISAATSRRSYAFTGLALAIGLGLAGCGSIDNALFGSNTESEPTAPAPANSSDQTSSNMPGTLPSTGSTSGGAPAGSAQSGSLTPVSIEAGSDTGTAVSHTIQGLRDELSGLNDKIVSAAQQLGELRNAAAQSAGAYHEAKAQITTRLEMGTTRGNPELVAQWNAAQSALDALTTNINSLNSVGSEIANDASRAHFVQDTIQATFNISGAVDEDHRQLSVLQDESGQTIVLIDRLLTEASADIQRQTAYVANERANLTTLASAIKNGEFYGTELGTPMMASVGAPVSFATPTGAPSGDDQIRSRERRLSANSLHGAGAGAPIAAHILLCSGRSVADPRLGSRGAARANRIPASRAGGHAIDDGYGRAGGAARHFLGDRSRRRLERSARLRALRIRSAAPHSAFAKATADTSYILTRRSFSAGGPSASQKLRGVHLPPQGVKARKYSSTLLLSAFPKFGGRWRAAPAARRKGAGAIQLNPKQLQPTPFLRIQARSSFQPSLASTAL